MSAALDPKVSPIGTPLLDVRRLSVQLPSGVPVDGLSFTIAAGETLALLGESGCGKSMTALALMRLLPPPARIVGGQLLFDGIDLLALPEAEMRRYRGGELAMIFQEPATSLNPVLTIGEQITEAIALHGGRSSAAELLAAVGIPSPHERLRDYPFQLSGGMKQRAMIAMALAGAPKLLIADEPTTALDVTIQAQVLDLLLELQRARGMAMLLITHDLGIVARMAQRVGLMYAGELVELASRASFFSAAQHPYARALFAALPENGQRGGRLSCLRGTVPALRADWRGCRFAERCLLADERCRLDAPTWQAVGEDHLVRCHHVGQSERGRHVTRVLGMKVSPTHTPLLEVRDLAVHFPRRAGLFRRPRSGLRAVDGLSFALPAAKTLALVGESGCGKTTAGRAILGLLPPTRGEVWLDGRPIRGLAPRKMQMVFQDPFASLDPRLRIADILAEGLRALKLEGDVGDLLVQVGLERSMLDRYPHEFSGGQRQRIAIARALAVRPKLLIVDEPTSALDVSVQAQILNLLHELKETLGLAYLFITHNLGVVQWLADEVAVMYLGRIVEHGPTEQVFATPAHPYTEALLLAAPRLDRASERVRLSGEPPSPWAPPAGCHFHPRCPRAQALCREKPPVRQAVGEAHTVVCHFPRLG